MASTDGDRVPLLHSILQPENSDGDAPATNTVDNPRAGHCHKRRVCVDKGPTAASRKARQKLILASILCLLFMIGEAAGGFMAGSLALMTDAAHMLSDFAGFLISLFAIWVAQRPATKKMSFGFYRAEVVGALASVLLIWILTGVLVYQAIQRLRVGEHKIDANVMLITAAVGVAVNIFLALVLHQHSGHHGHSHGGGGGGHGHSHGHSHGHRSVQSDHDEEVADGGNEVRIQIERARREEEEKNINVRAAFIHVIGDMVQSVGVLIAAYIIYFYPNLTFIDPVCTFLFSILVLVTTLKIFRDAIHVLMEGSPKGISYEEVKHDLESIPGVKMAHGLHMWCITMGRVALAVHLVIDPDHSATQQGVLQEAQQLVRGKYNMQHTTIQVEMYHIDMDDCTQCQDPKD